MISVDVADFNCVWRGVKDISKTSYDSNIGVSILRTDRAFTEEESIAAYKICANQFKDKIQESLKSSYDAKNFIMQAIQDPISKCNQPNIPTGAEDFCSSYKIPAETPKDTTADQVAKTDNPIIKTEVVQDASTDAKDKSETPKTDSSVSVTADKKALGPLKKDPFACNTNPTLPQCKPQGLLGETKSGSVQQPGPYLFKEDSVISVGKEDEAITYFYQNNRWKANFKGEVLEVLPQTAIKLDSIWEKKVSGTGQKLISVSKKEFAEAASLKYSAQKKNYAQLKKVVLTPAVEIQKPVVLSSVFCTKK